MRYSAFTPGQAVPPPVVAVAVMRMVAGALPLFISVCAGIDVVPFVLAPVIEAGILAVHAMVAPGVFELKETALVVPPEQMV